MRLLSSFPSLLGRRSRRRAPAGRLPSVLCLMAALTGLAISAPAFALDVELPAALKGVAPAGVSCQRDDRPASAPAGVVEVEQPEADLRCALPVAELVRLRASSTPMLIDTRGAPEHDAIRIDTSVPMSPSQLRSKPFLRDRLLVLVGSGKGEEALYVACADLKARGFTRVRVLQGGMAHWLAQGQPVVGRDHAPAESASLSTAELWLDSQFDANLVLVAPSHSGLQAHLSTAKLLSEVGPAQLKTLLAQRRKALKDAPLHAIVLATDARALSASLRQSLVAAASPVPMLFYTAGADEFLRDMRQQQLTWRAYARGPRLPPCGR